MKRLLDTIGNGAASSFVIPMSQREQVYPVTFDGQKDVEQGYIRCRAA